MIYIGLRDPENTKALTARYFARSDSDLFIFRNVFLLRLLVGILDKLINRWNIFYPKRWQVPINRHKTKVIKTASK